MNNGERKFRLKIFGTEIENLLVCVGSLYALLVFVVVLDSGMEYALSARIMENFANPHIENVRVLSNNFKTQGAYFQEGRRNVISEDAGRTILMVERASGQQLEVKLERRLTDTPATATLTGYQYQWLGGTQTVLQSVQFPGGSKMVMAR